MKFLEDKQLINEAAEAIFEATRKTKKQEPKEHKAKLQTDEEKARDKKEKELKKSQEAEQKKIKEEANKPEVEKKSEKAEPTGGVTATALLKENSRLITEILWTFLSPERRKKLDEIFYNEVKNNSLYVTRLDAKDEDFSRALAKSKLAQQKQPEQVKDKEPEVKQETNPKPSQTTSTTDNKIVYKQSFEQDMFNDLILESVLGDLAKSAVGLKPQKVKEIQLNAKAVYNNCVLILTIESYLSNVMISFIKINGIKVDRSRYQSELSFDENDESIDALKDIAVSNNIQPDSLESYITNMKLYAALARQTGSQTEQQKQELETVLNKIQKFENKFEPQQLAKLKADLEKANYYLKDLEIASYTPDQQMEIISELFTTISNFFREKLKVVDLASVDHAKFQYYVNYLFNNKQFFIEQTQMLNKHLGTYRAFGTRFYQILADFNALEPEVKEKLIESSFKEESGFSNLYPQIEKITKLLAINIVRNMKKEIDSVLPASFKAGVKTGEFLGRLVSGQHATRPVNPKDSGATED